MRRRPANTADNPLDIFDDERFSRALSGATQPPPPASAQTPEPSQSPSTPHALSNAELSVDPDLPPQSQTPRAEQQASEGGGHHLAATETRSPPEPNVTLRFRVPQTLRSEFQTFKAELAAVLGGIALDDSNLARPLLEHFLVEYRTRILEEAAALRGRLKRPANGDTVGMAEFDHTIGEIFRKARLRRSPGSSSQSPTS